LFCENVRHSYRLRCLHLDLEQKQV
jgi:hypothetical protein